MIIIKINDRKFLAKDYLSVTKWIVFFLKDRIPFYGEGVRYHNLKCYLQFNESNGIYYSLFDKLWSKLFDKLYANECSTNIDFLILDALRYKNKKSTLKLLRETYYIASEFSVSNRLVSYAEKRFEKYPSCKFIGIEMIQSSLDCDNHSWLRSVLL